MRYLTLPIALAALCSTLVIAQQRGAQPPGGGRGRGPVQVMSLTSSAWPDGGQIPAKYTQEGDDVSPAALNETLQLFSDGTVDLLAYNEQTSSPETEQVEQAATDAGVAIVPVTELLPTGDDYVSWQQSNIDAITAALDK